MRTIVEEQTTCLEYYRSGKSLKEIGEILKLSRHQVRRRVKAAEKKERLDPELVERLAQEGVTDLSGLHSGWLLKKDKGGSGSSLYFYLGPDEDPISFADAMRDAIGEIPKLPPLVPQTAEGGEGYATWLALADMHLGGEYGSSELEEDFNAAVDDICKRLPPAEKAFVFELGDLFDANDHKGVTPASGNPCDVKRDDMLGNTQLAIRVLKRAIYRLLETHKEVEVHLIPGNHDPDSYLAVMIGLDAHFSEVEQVTIHVTDDEFRVVPWGNTAAFPHHGHTLKAPDLKDVFSDQFPDEWANAKAYRLIMTGHLHHMDRGKDLTGAESRQFRTLHRPNKWARMKGMFSYASLNALTVHAERGPEFETISPIKPLLRGKPQ